MKIALITIVHNEFIFLPLWFRYYHDKVNTIHVVNHLDEGSLDLVRNKYDFIESKVDWPLFDVGTGQNMTNEYKAWGEHYLKTHDWVIIADSDEFIIHKNKTFRQYLMDKSDNYIAPMGYEPIQTITEADIKWHKPLLKQRKYWRYVDDESKPCIFNKVPNWCDGGHYLLNEKKKVSNDIYIIHCKYIDKNLKRKNEQILPFNITADLKRIPMECKLI